MGCPEFGIKFAAIYEPEFWGISLDFIGGRMVQIMQGDEDPKVVLVQIALSTRPPQAPLRVDGKFGAKTKAAVQQLQKMLVRPQTGVVEGPEWKAMTEAMPFGVFDHTDIDETVVAIVAGKTGEQIAADKHQYGIRAKVELEKYGQAVSSIGIGASNGVGLLVSRIVQAGQSKPLGLLRIFGHGGKGLQMINAGRGGMPGGAAEHASALTPTITRQMRPELKRAASAFRSYGSAELHGCRVADGSMGRLLLKDLADEWGVPVTAAVDRQRVGGGTTLRFEGRTVTAFPGRVSLLEWAQKVAALSAYSRA